MADAKTIRLRHVYREGDWVLYFYDGETLVKNSVVTIPADRPEWVRRAYVQGFRLDADGNPITDIDLHVERETAEPAKAEPKRK